VLALAAAAGAAMSIAAPIVQQAAEQIVATSITQDLAAQGEAWTVTCDGAIPSLAPGAAFECAGSSASGDATIAGTVTDAAGAFSYRVQPRG
jgi:hypothetical protein